MYVRPLLKSTKFMGVVKDKLKYVRSHSNTFVSPYQWVRAFFVYFCSHFISNIFLELSNYCFLCIRLNVILKPTHFFQGRIGVDEGFCLTSSIFVQPKIVLKAPIFINFGKESASKKKRVFTFRLQRTKFCQI